MSIHVISAVLNCRDPDLTSSRRMVLVSLANYAGEDGHAWPSQKLVSEESGCGIRSLKDHLKWLEANGFIRRDTKNLGQGKGSRTSYHVDMKRLARTSADASAQNAGAKTARAKSVPLGGGIPHLTNRQEPSLGGVVLTRARCFEAAGLTEADAMNSPGLVSTIDIERLLRDPKHPCDFDQDVIPAIQTCAASLRKKGQTLSTWSYCRAAILRNRDQRLQGNPAPTDAPAGQPSAPARNQKHGGGGIVAASLRVAAKLRESRGIDDDHGGETEPLDGGGLGGVFSNNRRIAGTG